MKLTFIAAAFIAAPFASFAAPTGGEALDCDQSMWKPVLSADGEVLYWNNRTCAIQEDGSVFDMDAALGKQE